MHLKIDVIMDEIKYYKKCMALNTTPSRKQIFRKISCNQCPCHHHTGCPSRKEIIWYSCSVFSFWYLILRTHTAEILIPILEMRTARFRKSGQLPFPHRARKGQTWDSSPEVYKLRPLAKISQLPFFIWSLSHECFLHFLRVVKHQKKTTVLWHVKITRNVTFSVHQ